MGVEGHLDASADYRRPWRRTVNPVTAVEARRGVGQLRRVADNHACLRQGKLGDHRKLIFDFQRTGALQFRWVRVRLGDDDGDLALVEMPSPDVLAGLSPQASCARFG